MLGNFSCFIVNILDEVEDEESDAVDELVGMADAGCNVAYVVVFEFVFVKFVFMNDEVMFIFSFI